MDVSETIAWNKCLDQKDAWIEAGAKDKSKETNAWIKTNAWNKTDADMEQLLGSVQMKRMWCKCGWLNEHFYLSVKQDRNQIDDPKEWDAENNPENPDEKSAFRNAVQSIRDSIDTG
jgi:hypothetical protein